MRALQRSQHVMPIQRASHKNATEACILRRLFKSVVHSFLLYVQMNIPVPLSTYSFNMRMSACLQTRRACMRPLLAFSARVQWSLAGSFYVLETTVSTHR